LAKNGRKLPKLIVVVIVCAFAVPAGAQECPQRVDLITWSSPAHQVAASGNYVYIGTDGGLLVVEYMGPQQTDVLSGIGLPEPAGDIAVSNGYVYVADGYSGLRVIDVRDPSHPLEVGRHIFEPFMADVTVFGRTAYLAGENSGENSLHLVDVTDPFTPEEIGRLIGDDGFGWGEVAVAGSYAYWGGRSLHVIDVSSPTSPIEVGCCQSSTFSSEYVSLMGRYACVSGDLGWAIIDVGNPEAPEPVYEDNDWRFLTSSAVSNQLLFLTLLEWPPWGALLVYDVSQPTNPVLIGSTDLPTEEWQPPYDVAISGRFLYVAAADYGVLVFDITGCLPDDPDQEMVPHVD
jgi:hypothetical protein